MTVTQPDASVWWDPALVVADVLARLRLGDVDVDADWIAALVDPAGQALNQRLDRDPADALTVATAPPQLHEAIVRVVIELYRDKDAPPSSVDGMIAASWRPPSLDPTLGVRYLIEPFKTRRGVA